MNGVSLTLLVLAICSTMRQFLTLQQQYSMKAFREKIQTRDRDNNNDLNLVSYKV